MPCHWTKYSVNRACNSELSVADEKLVVFVLLKLRAAQAAKESTARDKEEVERTVAAGFSGLVGGNGEAN